MIGELIHLAILCVIVGFIAWIVLLIVAQIPMPSPFQQIARAAVMIVALLFILLKVLPLLGVSV